MLVVAQGGRRSLGRPRLSVGVVGFAPSGFSHVARCPVVLGVFRRFEGRAQDAAISLGLICAG